MVTLDFETRSRCDIRKHSAWIYSKDPSTEILCMAYKIEDQEVKIWTPKDKEFPADLSRLVNKTVFEAHNSSFEYAMWNNCGVPKYGFPTLSINFIKCSAAKAAACSLPRALGKAGEALGLATQKDDTGKIVMLQMCKPRIPSKNNPSEWFDDEERFNTLYEYCKQDVLAEHALSEALPELNEEERINFFLDADINTRGVFVDIPTVKKIISLVKEFKVLMRERVASITDGELTNVSQIRLVLKWLAQNGCDLISLTKQDVESALERSDISEKVRKVLETRQQLGKTSTTKYEALLNYTDTDQRARLLLLFNGANTGRWGGKGFQPQNLPRGTIKNTDLAIEVLRFLPLDRVLLLYGEDFMDAVSSCIRGMICAAPGKKLIVSDYSSIEARVLLWLAGDERSLNLFRENKDLYVDMAATIYKIPTSEVTKDQRAMGKQAILGLGYQMGALRFRKECLAKGIEISEHLAEEVVSSYRDKYDRITNLWNNVQRAMMRSIQNRSIEKCTNNIQFESRGKHTYLTLPSGRKLRYNFAFLEKEETSYGVRNSIRYMGVNSQTRKWEKQQTYGGKITENITQAVARDLLATAIRNIDNAGYRVILHVHDEVISEVPDSPEYSIDEFNRLMTTLPSWAKGLPISAEGWEGQRYKK